MLFILLQGRNVDALILYFGEDPARCPFEQGICLLHQYVVLLAFQLLIKRTWELIVV